MLAVLNAVVAFAPQGLKRNCLQNRLFIETYGNPNEVRMTACPPPRDSVQSYCVLYFICFVFLLCACDESEQTKATGKRSKAHVPTGQSTSTSPGATPFVQTRGRKRLQSGKGDSDEFDTRLDVL